MKQLQLIEASRPHDDRVQFVSLSIDSANDTAKTLKAYGQELGLPLGKSWRLVSGAPETVQQFAEKTLHLGVEPGEQLHSTSVVVIDGTGEIRGTFSIMEQEGATRLQSTLTALLKQLPVAASEPDPSANAPR